MFVFLKLNESLITYFSVIFYVVRVVCTFERGECL